MLHKGCDCLDLLAAAAIGQAEKAEKATNDVVAAAHLYQVGWISDAMDLLARLQEANAALDGELARRARKLKGRES